MLEDLEISRQFVSFMPEDSELYLYHSERLEYLQSLIGDPNATETKEK